MKKTRPTSRDVQRSAAERLQGKEPSCCQQARAELWAVIKERVAVEANLKAELADLQNEVASLQDALDALGADPGEHWYQLAEVRGAVMRGALEEARWLLDRMFRGRCWGCGQALKTDPEAKPHNLRAVPAAG